MSSGDRPGPLTSRWVGVAAAVAAIALLVLGVWSRDWLRGVDYGIESRLGLRLVELCQMVEPAPGEAVRSCETVSLDAIAESRFAPDGFERYQALATASWWSGLAAAGLVLLCLLLALIDRPLDLPVHPTTLALLTSAAALLIGGLTLALNPYSKLVGWGSGRGFVLFGVGAALGLFAAIVLGRTRRLPPSEFDP
jgi:hypothetical protein